MISVIIPVYNVEKYLNRCVDSVLGQSYTDFELILVDDGSPDKCPAICDEYALQDKRIKVIHKQNGGLSSARNAGLEIAKGDYIAFVDSDDFIHPDYLRLLYQALKETGADISICDFHWIKYEEDVNIKKEEIQKITEYDNYTIFQYDEALGDGCNWKKIVAWNKLYKKEIFFDIRFPEGKINEDVGVYYKCFYSSKKIVVINNKLYYYFYNEFGIMNSPFSEKRFDEIDLFLEEAEYFNSKLQTDKRYLPIIQDIYVFVMRRFKYYYETYKEFDFKGNNKALRIEKQLKKILKKNKVFLLCYTNLPYYEFYFGKNNLWLKINYFIYKLKNYFKFKKAGKV